MIILWCLFDTSVWRKYLSRCRWQ